MKLGEESVENIRQAIRKLIANYPSDTKDLPVTDIYFHPVLDDANDLVILNDEEEEIARASIDEWNEREDDDADFYKETAEDLKECMKEFRPQLEKLGIFRPFSFFLTDADNETVSELLLIDDNLALLDDSFLQGWSKDLDDFLNNLMKE